VRIDEHGNVEIKLDSGRAVHFNLEQNRHLDYGYAVTSHSSQGTTADRVLVHIDTEELHEKLVNSRLAYVANFARPLRCADLYQRRRQSRERAQP